jgi:TrmH family RNA methyltransferase
LPVTRTELKKVKSLQTKKGRRTHGLFPAEGIRLLEEACRFEVWPDRLYCAASLLTDRGQRLTERFQEAGVDIAEVSSADLTRMAATESSQGLLAVFPVLSVDPSKLKPDPDRNILVCEKLSDPGNVGTLLRSALAFGFDTVLMCEHSAEPFSPKVVRASMGAVFGLTIAVTSSETALAILEQQGIPLLAAAPSGNVPINQALSGLKRGPVAVAVGSEADGLSPRLLDRAFRVVTIRHRQIVESLNSAVAGAILMKECYDSFSRRKK